MTREMSAAVSYFGKLPSRGDFVRTLDNHQLMALLDRWAGAGIELLSQEPNWKQLYDSASDVDYAFLGSRSRLAICGHFLPSRDASERRFPFLSAIRLDVSDPLGFIARSPMALMRLWAGLGQKAAQAQAADDPTAVLRELADSRYDLRTDPAAYAAPFRDFTGMQTVGSMEALLHQAGHAHAQLKFMLPALGLLLQPLLAGGPAQIDKGLEFPLPRDALYRPLVASFWLDLVVGFIARADFELAILASQEQTPRLIVGFNGADSQILQAVLDPRVASEYLIRIEDSEWVEDQLAGDYALNKLASYIDRPELSLQTARKIFGETFLGA